MDSSLQQDSPFIEKPFSVKTLNIHLHEEDIHVITTYLASTSKFPSQVKPSSLLRGNFILTFMPPTSHFQVTGIVLLLQRPFCHGLVVHHLKGPFLLRHRIRPPVSLQAGVTKWQAPVGGTCPQVVCTDCFQGRPEDNPPCCLVGLLPSQQLEPGMTPLQPCKW